jgi:uncharacterized membrane protein
MKEAIALSIKALVAGVSQVMIVTVTGEAAWWDAALTLPVPTSIAVSATVVLYDKTLLLKPINYLLVDANR